MVELFANSGDLDQTPHSVVSDLGLHCLPITLLGVFRLQWVQVLTTTTADDIIYLFIYLERTLLGISCESADDFTRRTPSLIFPKN